MTLSTLNNFLIFSTQCIFCERPKYVNRTLEKLVKATQLRVDQTLRQIATGRCDQRILAITSRDIVAAEAHYHRSCYRDYTRPAQQQQPEKNQTTEVTVNKDTKSIGGITKYSLKTGAVNRFYMTTEYRCSFLAHLRDMVQVKRPSYHHDDMLSTRKRKDEQAVKAVENLIENWNNPFTESKELVNLSTAKQAPEDVTKDLLNAQEVGGKAYQVFREQRLESFPPQKKFHGTIKLNKLKTFSFLTKKKKVLWTTGQ
ncbi:hypothetical protein QZH41_007590 [Actinostola sp. cb2023]|nr:hypothetical protein QZH41_007590 [Actinostola sp. cb2023]